MLKRSDLNHLYQYACSLTNNDEEAYDFVHDAVIKVQKYEPDNIRSYTKMIIRNLFFDRHKKRKREISEEIDRIGNTEDLESIVISKNSVSEILKKIQPDERELLYLWAVEGKTIQEISEETGIKLGTLLSKISRLRKKIILMESDHDNI